MRKLVIILLSFILILTIVWQIPAVLLSRDTDEIIRAIQVGDRERASQKGEKLRDNEWTRYLRAYLAYEEGEYSVSRDLTSNLSSADATYLHANAWYRIGESQSDTTQKIQSWIRSIESYDLAMQSLDNEWIVQNRDFVREKLDELADEDQQGEGQDGQEDPQDQDSGSDEGDASSGEGSGQGEGGQDADIKELSPQDKQVIQEYIQQLEDEQDELQPYLDRFGAQEPDNAFTSLEEYFFGGSGDDKKDW